ncbi:uncharacterized protein LOC114010563 [Falco peregrinus]|uniref:uncharacterized protein LOC114010563 n=1 Tax=Falco peregrinus TaxID=8954 RepID=UPI000FFC47B8|nr:uncharacterized protein LOC114010563 [Falco peregrinus]
MSLHRTAPATCNHRPPGCVCSAGDEGRRHATGTQQEIQHGGCKGRAAQAAVLTCSSTRACVGPLALLPSTAFLLENSWPQSSSLSKPGPPRERCRRRDTARSRACAQVCVRVCKAGERAQRHHSLAQEKEFLPRAAYHLGNLRFPAERSMSYPELSCKQPGTLAGCWLPRGSMNAQAPPSPGPCGQGQQGCPWARCQGAAQGSAQPERDCSGRSSFPLQAAAALHEQPLSDSPVPCAQPWCCVLGAHDLPSSRYTDCLCYSKAPGRGFTCPTARASRGGGRGSALKHPPSLTECKYRHTEQEICGPSSICAPWLNSANRASREKHSDLFWGFFWLFF